MYILEKTFLSCETCVLSRNVQHVEGSQYLVEVEVEGCWGFVYQSTVISSNKESHQPC
jgi:hypothetical protein